MAHLRLGALIAAAILRLIVPGVGGVLPSGTSAFVAPYNRAAFALNLPNDGSNDIYFSFSSWSNVSWAAVGMGSDKMLNTLMFMMYPDNSRRNITLSPRLSYGYVEPSYSPDINITVLPGTGIEGDQMHVNAVCHNCFSWEGGRINQDAVNAPFIFAFGPHRGFKSDSVTASVPIHTLCGTFTMDLTRASGPPGVPDLVNADTSGTIVETFGIYNYLVGVSHASLMALSVLILIPSGILFMRLVQKRVWHTVCQTLATSCVVFGLLTGIYCATLYNRTKNYASAHQILGIIVLVAVIVQFGIGFKLFRLYVRGFGPRKLLPIHIWLGRLVFLGGLINLFLGLRLSYRDTYGWRYIGVIGMILLSFVIVRLLIWARERAAPIVVEVQVDGHTWNYRTSSPPIRLAAYPNPRTPGHRA